MWRLLNTVSNFFLLSLLSELMASSTTQSGLKPWVLDSRPRREAIFSLTELSVSCKGHWQYHHSHHHQYIFNYNVALGFFFKLIHKNNAIMTYNHFYSIVYELTVQFAKIHSLKICFSVISCNNYIKSARTSVKALFYVYAETLPNPDRLSGRMSYVLTMH